MKTFWIDAREKGKDIVTTAIESSADAILVEKGRSQSIRELAVTKTISEDGDLKLGRDVYEIEISSKKDETKAKDLGKKGTVIVKAKDWTIIPLENLIASKAKVIAHVTNSAEAKIALEILEKGADGILLETEDIGEIKKTGELLKRTSGRIELVPARITRIESVGSGDRSCVDTCTNMVPGQGMLVGNSGAGMFLVNSESIDNPYVAARPFRVNAGGVHAYTLAPEGRTRYLSELKSGDKVLIVDHAGNTSEAIVGRNKIERRPMMLIEAKAKGTAISLILQNAETIRLVSPKGSPISVVKLKPGDEVLCRIERSGRHFGMKIDETIKEI